MNDRYELFVFVVVRAISDGDDDTVLVDDINTGHAHSVDDGLLWITWVMFTSPNIALKMKLSWKLI